jgi:hypothetical protein
VVIDLDDFLATVLRLTARHGAGKSGAYGRWSLPSPDDASKHDGINPYGCADAANLLYTVGVFPAPREWPAWIDVLRSFQEPQSGLFRESTHDPLHTTAHVLGALELFGAGPTHALTALASLRDPLQMQGFLDGLDWTWNPWGESHKGAGLYAALVLANEADPLWQRVYFEWLWDQADPETGFWRKGCVAAGGDAMLFHHLAGSFHYLFNHEYARQPLRYPQQMVDSCLRIARDNLFPPLGKTVGFAELDWVYCLDRAQRQSGYRFAESKEALSNFADRYCAYLFGLDPETDAGLDDLHQLLGAVSALAALQQALPGHLLSQRPLRLVLDRRPFI